MGKSTTQTTENRPPEWATPLFTRSAEDAMKLYDSGVGGNVYQGPTVAGLGSTTMSGINMLNGMGGTDLSSSAKRLQSGTNLGSTSNRLLGGIASGNQGINTSQDWRAAINASKGPSAADQYLKSYARGDNLDGEGNPFYRQRLEKEIADSNALIQSQFAGAGRFGSGANQATIADNTSDMLMTGLENDWNREQANQFNAVGMIDAGRQAQMGNRLSAISGLTGTQNQNIQNRLSGANSILGAKNSDFQNRLAGTQTYMDGQNKDFQNRLTLSDKLLQSGGLEDAKDQQFLQADYAKWLAEDMQPWTRLGLLQSSAAGSAGNYGTNVQTQQQPFNPLSALGGIGSLFTKSDARVKTGIVPVGVENGFVVYEFNYHGSKARWRGVMAQDVIEKVPEAVTVNGDFYAVNYDRIGVEMRRVA